jgi:hypothetical protein
MSDTDRRLTSRTGGTGTRKNLGHPARWAAAMRRHGLHRSAPISPRALPRPQSWPGAPSLMVSRYSSARRSVLVATNLAGVDVTKSDGIA